MQLLPLPTETIPKNRSQGLIRAYGIIHYLGMVELKYTLADEILGACHLDSILNLDYRPILSFLESQLLGGSHIFRV